MPKAVKGKTGKRTGSKKDQNIEKAIHPYSRRAKQISRKIHHFNKVETSKSTRVAKLELVSEKLRWFQDHVDDRESYTQDDLVDLVLEYRNRFEDELEQINIVQSVGKRNTQTRQHASREAAIKFTKEDEKNHFQGCGMEVPDLITSLNLKLLKTWKGELNLIQCIKLVTVSVKGVQGLESAVSKTDQIETDDNDDNKMSNDGEEEGEDDGDDELT